MRRYARTYVHASRTLDFSAFSRACRAMVEKKRENKKKMRRKKREKTASLEGLAPRKRRAPRSEVNVNGLIASVREPTGYTHGVSELLSRALLSSIKFLEYNYITFLASRKSFALFVLSRLLYDRFSFGNSFCLKRLQIETTRNENRISAVCFCCL